MNHLPNHARQIGLAGSLIVLCLTGCGGGSDAGSSSNSGRSASAEMIASFNSIADYCGVKATMPVSAPSMGYDALPLYFKSRDRYQEQVSALFSTGGNDSADLGLSLKVDVSDYRGLTAGVYVSKGLAEPAINMGVNLLPNLPTGGIACVKSVAWLKTVGTAVPLPSNPSNLPERTLVWESYVQPTLPIASLPAYPVDGFELVGNFTPRTGQSYFPVKKSDIPDASAVSICHLPGKSTTWNCAAPKITDQTVSWTFSIDEAKPGTYMLTSTHSAAKQ
jgi:hypothetical protein